MTSHIIKSNCTVFAKKLALLAILTFLPFPIYLFVFLSAFISTQAHWETKWSQKNLQRGPIHIFVHKQKKAYSWSHPAIPKFAQNVSSIHKNMRKVSIWFYSLVNRLSRVEKIENSMRKKVVKRS